MSLLLNLSPQIGDRSETPNQLVASLCMEHPKRLAEIATGLSGINPALVGDCAEVMTLVSEQQPEHIAPFAPALAKLLEHKTTRVRWEAVHALVNVSQSSPEIVENVLSALAELIRSDPSAIVRDYAVDAVANFAASGQSQAEKAFPLLKEALEAWKGRHAGHALSGLVNVAMLVPELRPALGQIANGYLSVEKAVVRKAAKTLQKAASAV